ncbi:sn-glycerol 3-phosphate transport system permease protein [Cupriavidus gilardii J11]|uniref:sn-glycerol 3-phosphate transport system permease protein n=1 Tax=Cupriavidus gilardii J11 TaxID=936133 RepID=A0A562BF26_9BURK|nr:sn-glycerol 3-phosphate transport system permease protein [Cupriavidus gilardii J11]
MRHRLPATAQTAQAWLMLLPALVLLAAFTYWPIAGSLWQSLHTQAPGIAPAYSGADQYAALLDDPVFRQALRNNFWYALVTVPASVVLALAMALWVNQRFAGRGLLRLAFFTPTVLPMVAAANVWLFFYAPDIGLLNKLLASIGVDGRNWLGDTETVLPALMVVTVWKEAGFFMIFYLAALQSLSSEQLDAARLEAPSAWFRLRHVVLPLLAPTTLFVVVNALINAFKLVDHLFVLTRGGPNNASTLLLYYLYEIAFKFQDAAYAGALTVVLLGLLALCSAVQFWLSRNRVHYR